MPHIVLGIDGTDSRSYRNRWVEQFVRDIDADYTFYQEGPNDAVTGWECSDRYQSALGFLNRTLRGLGISPNISPANLRLTLVGHSRGGHAVIALARDIPYRVDFLGLYDAVDMTSVLGDTAVIRNTNYCFHAMRAPYMNSRSSWGNTGTTITGGQLYSAYFATSHGGVGGDPGDSAPTPVIGDESCVYRPPQPVTLPMRPDSILIPARAAETLGEAFPDISGMCTTQSQLVHQWMREKAIERGLRFRR